MQAIQDPKSEAKESETEEVAEEVEELMHVVEEAAVDAKSVEESQAPKTKLKSKKELEAEDKAAAQEPKPKQTDDPEKKARTVFLGNLPTSVLEKAGQKLLKQKLREFGKLESIRFRSLALKKPTRNAEVRAIEARKGDLHPERDSVNGYAVFADTESVDKCIRGINGTLFEGKHLRVDYSEPRQFDAKKSVFVGNLPFNVTEEALWKLFEGCGAIEGVRIIRDQVTNVGKGFAYVGFKERSSAAVAITMEDKECMGRKIRLSRCSRKERKHGQKQTLRAPTGAELRLVKKAKKHQGVKRKRSDKADAGDSKNNKSRSADKKPTKSAVKKSVNKKVKTLVK